MPSQPAIPIPLPTIRPTSPSGASPFALLPHELMAQVFLHLDPHTLYTSIRQLNHQWKVTVEQHVIPTLFRTRQWRVALRIHKKPRRVHPNSAEGVAQAQQQQAMARGGREESEEARRERVLGTIGAWEDELDASTPGDLTPPTITEYIPLTLSSLSPSTNTFHFTTGANWYALYEIDDPVSAINDPSFRLDLNFGFAWRFEGDGKEDAPQRAGGWTSLDRENRWLSEFWCSTYDLGSRAHNSSKGEEEGEERVRLNATRLARRRRLPVSLPAGTSKAKGSTNGNPRRNPRTTLAWDDAHIEYLHLDVALGTEFFVRRSARANLLLRALEAEAARREEEEEEVLREKIAAAATASRPATPSQAQKLSTPSAWATPPKLQKPKATRAAGAGTPPVASSASSSKASSPPQASSTPLNGSTSPPPSSAPSSANSSAFLSPAEQLQLMAKSKAAAKVAGRRSANASTSSRAASRAASRANSRAPSAAPSRAPSRPPSRPGTPSGSGPSSSSAAAAAAAARSPSPSPSPALHSHSASGYSTPGRDRDRDLPFTRAAALAQSTASPYTARALSGYTTPNLASAANVTLHPALTQARHSSGSMSRGVSADSGYATPTRGATVPAGTSFAARGGGGAQPGGTPFAQFRGRLRRVERGFEGVEQGWGRGREERRRGKTGVRRKRERSETVTAQRWAGVSAEAEEGVKGMSLDDETGPSSPSYDESESEDESAVNGGDAGEFGWQRSAVPYEGEGMMRTWREAKLLSSPEDTKGAGKGKEASLQGGGGAAAAAAGGEDVGEIREVRPGVVETEWVWSR